MKRVVFLSHVIDENTPLYGGLGDIILKKQKAVERGDSCNTMQWSFPNHTGTHMDAPSHFIGNKRSITDFQPQDFVFSRIELVKISGVKCGYAIGPQDLTSVKDCDFLLIKTDFEKYREHSQYWNDSPYLVPEAAAWLKDKCPSIRALGVDFISISNLNNRELGRQAHRSFLSRDIALVEDMKLKNAHQAPDSIIIAPLRVKSADGAPCTVLGIYN